MMATRTVIASKLQQDLYIRTEPTQNNYYKISTRSGFVKFSIINGDITQINADALICPSGHLFKFNEMGGVERAIAKKFGLSTFEAAEREANARISRLQAANHKPTNMVYRLPKGLAIPVQLPSQFNNKMIIHVNSAPELTSTYSEDLDTVAISTIYALKVADREKMESVAIPALGAGFLYRMPLDHSLKAVITGMREYFSSRNYTHIKRVMFVKYSKSADRNGIDLHEVAKKVLLRKGSLSLME